MENMPKNIINKIFLFTSHPVADVVRASGIFKVLEHTNQNDLSPAFEEGAHAGYNGYPYDPGRWHNASDIELYTCGYEHDYRNDGRKTYAEECEYGCRFHIEPQERLEPEASRRR
jgi:hypothetical protein